ncbi:MAG: NUDIX domain-containing protein [Acetobacteraceae bacterium]
MTHHDVVTLSTETVWKRHTQLDVVQFQARRFDGSMSPVRTWEVWRRGAAAGLLPYDPVTDQLVMLEQFRYPALVAGLDPVLLEIPAGFIDSGEEPEQAAARETQEEMGLAADRVERIGRFLLSAGGSDETATLYVGRVRAPSADADGIAGYGGLASENEDIRIRVLPAAAAIEGALAGAYPNSITTIALLWFAVRREGLRTKWLA